MTPWIKWKEKSPTEADLPIECTNFGADYPDKWSTYIPLPGKGGDYSLWRPYICDIPKAEEVKWPVGYNGQGTCTRHMHVAKDGKQIALDIYRDGKTIVWNEEKYIKAEKTEVMTREEHIAQLKAEIQELWDVDEEDEPTPDANGWWRIEDRKPEHNQIIKFYHGGEVRIGVVNIDRPKWDTVDWYNVAERKIYRATLDLIHSWCPLDMTGPVEK